MSDFSVGNRLISTNEVNAPSGRFYRVLISFEMDQGMVFGRFPVRDGEEIELVMCLDHEGNSEGYEFCRDGRLPGIGDPEFPSRIVSILPMTVRYDGDPMSNDELRQKREWLVYTASADGVSELMIRPASQFEGRFRVLTLDDIKKAEQRQKSFSRILQLPC